ncbi:MAG: hypothetical protein ACPLRX_07485 [Candidatus Saccharicenans sp.]
MSNSKKIWGTLDKLKKIFKIAEMIMMLKEYTPTHQYWRYWYWFTQRVGR